MRVSWDQRSQLCNAKSMLVAGTGEPTLLTFSQTWSSIFHPPHSHSYQLYNCRRNSNTEHECIQSLSPWRRSPGFGPLSSSITEDISKEDVFHHPLQSWRMRKSAVWISLIQFPLTKLTALQMVNLLSVTKGLTKAASGKEGLRWLSVDEHRPPW